jgi:hypothetical protein
VFFTLLVHTVPAPSLVLVLDLSAEITARRRPDEDPAALAAARANYLSLTQRLPRAVVLDADRTPDARRGGRPDLAGRIGSTEEAVTSFTALGGTAESRQQHTGCPI